MDDRRVVTVDEAYELLGYLMASAETSTFEPQPYAVLRLVEAASRLMGHMLEHGGTEGHDWLQEFKREVDAKKGWINRDQQAASDFVREANVQLATELKRRALAVNSAQPGNG